MNRSYWAVEAERPCEVLGLGVLQHLFHIKVIKTRGKEISRAKRGTTSHPADGQSTQRFFCKVPRDLAT